MSLRKTTGRCTSAKMHERTIQNTRSKGSAQKTDRYKEIDFIKFWSVVGI